MIRKLLDKTFLRFILVGIVNTLFGTVIMFALYNLAHFGYWISSTSNYVFGSILSYFLNKRFTFQNKDKGARVVVRFGINIAVCYFLAYGVSRPLVRWLLSGMSLQIQDNTAMLVGMCVYVVLNYLGQRFFAFREDKCSMKE